MLFWLLASPRAELCCTTLFQVGAVTLSLTVLFKDVQQVDSFVGVDVIKAAYERRRSTVLVQADVLELSVTAVSPEPSHQLLSQPTTHDDACINWDQGRF